MFHTLFPFAVVLLLGLSVPISMVVLPRFLAPSSSGQRKGEAYECGVDAVSKNWKRPFNVKYFVVALAFLVFDIETAFLFPWAVLFRTLGFLGIVEMGLFMAVLFLGLVYVWKKGGLSWK